MLQKITHLHTKRFLRKTIQSFKSCFSGSYQRLPKTRPCNRFNDSYKKTNSMKHKETNLIINNPYEVDSKKQENKKLNYGKGEDEPSKSLVTRKLKELEMMDQSDKDLVADIEEVLCYYARLTCPVYRDIIDKIFVDMYSGTFNLSRVKNSVSTRRLV